jgi:hypothetical protein
MISTDASNPKALRETVTRRGAGVGSALRGPCILVMPSGKGLPYPPWKEEREERALYFEDFLKTRLTPS